MILLKVLVEIPQVIIPGTAQRIVKFDPLVLHINYSTYPVITSFMNWNKYLVQLENVVSCSDTDKINRIPQLLERIGIRRGVRGYRTEHIPGTFVDHRFTFS
jgi:hypothetical protein